MREIKFRAWNKKIKSMGSALPLDVLIYDCTDINYDDLEIMQYTGLKDKNGKEIYEGDVVDYRYGNSDEPFILEIVFDAKKARFAEKQISNGNISDGSFLYSGRAEIIGNIYENPEFFRKTNSMKNLKDPVFEPESIGEKIADFIGTILSFLFVTMMILTVIALITIIGVEIGSAIWGDENVIYWISNLF